MIQLDGVSLRAGGRTVLDRVSFATLAGELVVVHGARGAGKSALLAVAAGRCLPSEGAVWLGLRNLIDLQRGSLPFVRRNIGYLPADPPLISDETALENVMLALAVRGDSIAAADRRARETLTVLGLEALADRPVATLSTGERRLVALARTLAPEPPMLVLDDPMVGLEAADRERVLAAQDAALTAGAAVLCASVEDTVVQAMVERGGRRLRLEDGRIIQTGPAISLVAPPHVRSETSGLVRSPVVHSERTPKAEDG